MSEPREPMFWDAEESEWLTHEDMDDAIHERIDSMPHDLKSGTWTLPRTLIVRGLAPMRVRAGSPERLLEGILEMLDEEHADPDSYEVTKPTPAMIEAARTFLDVVEREYVSWICEEVTSETIDVRAWMQENAGDYWDDFPGVDSSLVTWIGSAELAKERGA